jgi:hypothetical protein
MLSAKLRLFPDHRAGRPAAPGDEARGGRGLPPVTSLLLKRASASRPSGEWDDDDYDVLEDGAVVGRIMKAAAAPRRPVSLEGLSAFARSQKFLPPPEFDREYEGQLVVARVSPRELAAACPSAKPGRVVLGCARPGRGRCEVTIVNDDVLRSLGWTYEVVFVHERIVKIGRPIIPGRARRRSSPFGDNFRQLLPASRKYLLCGPHAINRRF